MNRARTERESRTESANPVRTKGEDWESSESEPHGNRVHQRASAVRTKNGGQCCTYEERWARKLEK
jgi:hypothetical protein